jgi:predicted nucleotidyltransferase
MDAAERRARMEALRDEATPARRRLLALGLLADRLREDGIEPVLVGGGALELYTGGGYATVDMDLALPLCPEVDAAFAELGFEKEGRYWVREDLDLLFEAPAPAGLPGEDAPRMRVKVEGLEVVVIGIEDLLLDRLRAQVHWKSDEDGRWARRLAALHSDRIDWGYLEAKVAESEAERAALAALREGLP